MRGTASITIYRPLEEVERLWNAGARLQDAEATVRIQPAPGTRGTEIHVQLADDEVPGALATPVKKLRGTEPVAKAKDELRRFKQLLETGEITRSDASPQGELLESKPRQRPAQPLDEAAREQAGV